MPLRDCVTATTTEVIDPTLSVGTVVFSGPLVTNSGLVKASLQASWTATGLSPYVSGIQFEITSPSGAVKMDDVRVAYGTWLLTDGVVGGQAYSVRYRAEGAPGVFGSWQGPSSVTAAMPTAPAPAAPGSSAWSAAGSTLTGADGSAMPAITLSGAFDGAFGTGILVEISPHGAATWVDYGTYATGTTSVIIDSVSSAQVVDIAVSYLNGQTQGARLVLNNGGTGYTAGSFAASGVATDKTPAAVNWTDQTASGTGTQTTTTNTQTISSINVPITLTLTYTNTASWSYIKNGGAPVGFSSGGTVSVVSGDTLAFRCSSGATVTSVLTIVNTTDASTTLDTTTATITVSGTDAIPDAITFATAYGDTTTATATGYTDTKSITGINVPVTLEVDFTGTGVSMIYSLNGGSYTSIANTGTIVVNNNDTLQFGVRYTNTVFAHSTGTVTIKNNSNGGATFTTFGWDLTVHDTI